MHNICSFSKADFVIVEVYSFSEFIISFWLDLVQWGYASDKFREVFTFSINLDLSNIRVFLSEAHWVYDLCGTLFFFISHSVCCYQISLFKCAHFLTVSNQNMMWHTTLIEFYIFRIVIVFLLF